MRIFKPPSMVAIRPALRRCLRAWVGHLSRVVLLLAAAAPAAAQTPADFYRGKTVSLLIGIQAGGAYDGYARLLARHLGRHIPGEPAVVPQNMPGAASLLLANYLYAAAPRDGLMVGAVQRGMPLNPLYSGGSSSGARYDATRFTWIGSASSETGVLLAMNRSGLGSFTDLFDRELIVGAEGGGTSDSELFARLTNAVLGTRARIVTGYRGSTDVLLAIEKGEVNGIFVGGWTGIRDKANPWLASSAAKLLVQLAVRSDPMFPDVPLIMDYAHDDRQRQILRLAFTSQLLGRPYVAPPGLPPERARLLREAFLATMRDPAFLAEAKRLSFEVGPLPGEEMAGLIGGLYASPPDIMEATRAAFRGERK
jgi:tripartite-type tricarboxylate transporter receptor subunit TctC